MCLFRFSIWSSSIDTLTYRWVGPSSFAIPFIHRSKIPQINISTILLTERNVGYSTVLRIPFFLSYFLAESSRCNTWMHTNNNVMYVCPRPLLILDDHTTDASSYVPCMYIYVFLLSHEKAHSRTHSLTSLQT